MGTTAIVHTKTMPTYNMQPTMSVSASLKGDMKAARRGTTPTGVRGNRNKRIIPLTKSTASLRRTTLWVNACSIPSKRPKAIWIVTQAVRILCAERPKEESRASYCGSRRSQSDTGHGPRIISRKEACSHKILDHDRRLQCIS